MSAITGPGASGPAACLYNRTAPAEPAQPSEQQPAQPPTQLPAQQPPSFDTFDRPEDDAPTLWESMQEVRKKAEEQREKYKIPRNGAQYGSASVLAYARLARAKRPAEVTAAAGYARRRIFQLKAAKRQDSDNAKQIQAVINQLEKAVSRAGKKKRDLQREQISEARRKKLEAERQRQKALRLQQQLQRTKTARMLRESGYIREAEIDNRLHAQLAQTEMNLRAQAQSLSAAMAPATDAAIQQYATQASAVAAPVPTETVSAEA